MMKTTCFRPQPYLLKHSAMGMGLNQRFGFSTGMQKGTKVTPKILCDIIGAKYYLHNEEIDMSMDTQVRLFDENDTHLGIVTLAEARDKASELGIDLVVRNQKLSPPILKIMNYRKELVKRLFQKIGREAALKTEDPKNRKTIQMTTMISVHDLENKKRQAIQFLKKYPSLNFNMRVNKYDPENVQKGKIMLMNIAEELKSYAKVKVSPVEEEEKEDTPPAQADTSKTLEERILENKKIVEEVRAEHEIQEDYVEDDEEDNFTTVKMVLESTVCFGEVDIDTLLENSTMEELMSNLPIGKLQTAEEAETAAEEEIEVKKYKGSRPELIFQSEQQNLMSKAQGRMSLKKKLKEKSLIFDEEDELTDEEDSEEELFEEDFKKLEEKDEMREFHKLCKEGQEFCRKAFDATNNPLGFFNFRGVEKEDDGAK